MADTSTAPSASDARVAEILARVQNSQLAILLSEPTLQLEKITTLARGLNRGNQREAVVELLTVRSDPLAIETIAQLLRYEEDADTFQRAATALKKSAPAIYKQLGVGIEIRRLLATQRINPRARLIELVQEPELNESAVERAICIAPTPILRSTALQILLFRNEERATALVARILVSEESELVVDETLKGLRTIDPGRLAAVALELIQRRAALSRRSCDVLAEIVGRSGDPTLRAGLRAFVLSHSAIAKDRGRAAVQQLNPADDADRAALLTVVRDARRSYAVRLAAVRKLLEGDDRCVALTHTALTEHTADQDQNALTLQLELSSRLREGDRIDVQLKAITRWLRHPSVSSELTAALAAALVEVRIAPWLGETTGRQLRELIERGALQPNGYELFQKLVEILPRSVIQSAFLRGGFKLPYNYHRALPKLSSRLAET